MADSRRFVLYGVGTGKSGTKSLAELFARDYRSAHEPESDRLAPLLCDVLESRLERRTLRRYLHARDRRLRLEVDASNLNSWITPELMDLRPTARFVLTWRDPSAWLDSLINHVLPRTPVPHWQRLRDLSFGGPPHGPGEKPLASRGLYSLDGYLRSWAERHQLVLATVPEQQLLVVRTENLSIALDPLARFVGVDPATLDEERAHSHRTRHKAGVLDELDPDLVAAKIAEHCGPALNQLEARTAATQ